jgi:hypothetical protein
MPALYRSARAGVKKHSGFFAIKAVAWYDLQSTERRGAAGGGAGRSWAWGDGGVDIRGALQGPELLMIVAVVIAPVDSPKGSISPSTFVPQTRFAALSLCAMALPVVPRGDTLGHGNRRLYSSM